MSQTSIHRTNNAETLYTAFLTLHRRRRTFPQTLNKTANVENGVRQGGGGRARILIVLCRRLIVILLVQMRSAGGKG